LWSGQQKGSPRDGKSQWAEKGDGGGKKSWQKSGVAHDEKGGKRTFEKLPGAATSMGQSGKKESP